MIAGDTPFIGASLENNGITARIGNTGHIHPGGLMTVAYNGQKATGKAFYQPVPFWASDDVNVLYPKFHLTENIALFLCPLFWEAGRPYAFENKWGREIMKDGTISLPAGEDGQPDWRVIDSWMMGIRSTARTHLDLLGRFI
ncbi:restriction endonuclease subunit S [Bifidobacterium tsurumiense]|uniref:Type I restriction modification protein n=1 Tax=Bifidobacterium tsurumiense TaxID=356829 RepID=A0A087E8C5_9BIFI|nr:restriction endonuclease subunit S [Bifidobacterium tsurumiense]KFJ04026.1 Type I restriction modification protein [Bifidobacterium tsurumiense]